MCKPGGVTVTPLADLPGRACSIAGALEVVGDRWALLVVREVSMGSHRFTDIVRGTGAPRDRLTARLNDLVAVGVLERRPYSTTPPRSGYHLTESGRDLLPVLHALLQWGDRWVAEEPPLRLHHAPAGQPDHARRLRLDVPHLRRARRRAPAAPRPGRQRAGDDGAVGAPDHPIRDHPIGGHPIGVRSGRVLPMHTG